MELNDEQLALLEELGSKFFSVEQASVVLQVSLYDMKVLMKDKNSTAYLRYNRGVYLSEMKLRDALLKTAERGSGPAQKQAFELHQRMKQDNVSI